MVNFFKKLFTWDHPAQGLVFALALLLFGSWSVWSLLVLCGGLSPVFMGLIACGFEGTSLADKIPWQSLLFALPLLFFFYFLVKLIYNIIVYNKQILKQWKWLLVSLICGSCFAAGIVLWVLLLASWKTIFAHPGDAEMFFSKQPSPIWLYSAVALGIGSFLAVSKLAANLAQIRLRNVFGIRTITVLSVFVLTYVVSVIMAMTASCNTANTIAELEKFFGKPLTPEAIRNDFYKGRKADGNFWKKIQHLRETAAKEIPIGKFRQFADENQKFSAEELKSMEQSLAKSKAFTEWKQLFSQKLPAPERNYETGKLSGILLPELTLLRDFCRLELAEIYFAIARKDKKSALSALKRMEHIYQYLSCDSILISGLVLTATEKYRLAGWEQMVNSGLLSDDELLKNKQHLEQLLAVLPKLHRQYIYGEAAMGIDCTELIAHGQNVKTSPKEQDSFIPAMHPYRWLSPALWYTMTRSKQVLAASYKVNDFTEVDDLHKDFSDVNFLGRMLLPALQSSGERFHELEMRYRIMTTIFELKLQQQKNGNLPEKFDLPTDWFSGQKCLFSKDPHGKITIWSIGRNRKNDNGVSDKSKNDDIVYTIFPQGGFLNEKVMK